MKKAFLRLVLVASCLLLLPQAILTVAAAEAAAEPVAKPVAGADAQYGSAVRMVWEENEVSADSPFYLNEGRVFVPIRFLADLSGAKLSWDAESNQLTLTAASGEKVTFYTETTKFYWNGTNYFMDTVPFVAHGRIYMPVKFAAEVIGLQISWDSDEQTLYVEQKEQASIAITASTTPTPTEEELRQYKEDLMLLAKIIEAEAGNEPYEGQVAVGSVILNRVESSIFPDSIYDVIHQPNQFGPVRTGKLDSIEPGEDALRAAEQVLEGKDLLEDAIYFHNPKRDNLSFFSKLTIVKDIGNHRFLK